MEYVSDGLGPNRRRIPPVRFPVWPILPPALEVKGVGPPLSSAADRYRRPPLSFPFPSPLCSPNPSWRRRIQLRRRRREEPIRRPLRWTL